MAARGPGSAAVRRSEFNRARAGEPPLGYVASPRLITKGHVPDGGVFDPARDYRANYSRIWGTG